MNVTANTLEGNALDGIRVDGASNHIISNNIIDQNTQNGIHFLNIVNNVTLIGNRITGGVIGILLSASGNQLSLSNNIVSGTSGDGVNVSGTDTTLVNNMINSVGGDGLDITSNSLRTTLRGNKLSSIVNNGVLTSNEKQSITVTTTDATQTTIASIVIQPATVANIRIVVVANSPSFGQIDDGCAMYLLDGLFRRSGLTTKIGERKVPIQSLITPVLWDVAVTAGGSQILIKVTGEAARTIYWKAFYEISEVPTTPP